MKTKKEKIEGWVTANLLDANQAKTLEATDDAMFALFETNFEKTLVAPPKKEEPLKVNTEEGKEVTKKVETPVPPTVNKEDEDRTLWANKSYKVARDGYIETIMGNKLNPYTAEELAGKSINDLEKLATLASNQTDMTAATPGSFTTPAGNADKGKGKPKIAPYVNKHQVTTK